jgi:hypothetical protein
MQTEERRKGWVYIEEKGCEVGAVRKRKREENEEEKKKGGEEEEEKEEREEEEKNLEKSISLPTNPDRD